MHFPFKVAKAIQAIGVLFREDNRDRMNYMRLLKLLYIADRESLKETGRQIVGGPVIAMERGPVLEEVYALIRGQHAEMPLWSEFFRKDRYDLEALKTPDVKQLSRYEIAKLQEIADRHRDHDEWELSRQTHAFPEWQKNSSGTSCQPIPLEDTLEALGLSKDAPAIATQARDVAFFNRVFER